MVTYDLNADVGEGFPYDEDLMGVITSANAACGFHAGDADTMRAVCAQAAANEVAVGAQVSYRDREGFGRRDLDVPYDDLVADLDEQVRALASACAEADTAVTYLKPHGALYNRAVWDAERAQAVAVVAERHRLPVLGLPGSQLLAEAGARGLPLLREFFADRAYDARGHLVPRSEEGAVIPQPEQVARRVRQLASDGTVTTIEGETRPVEADSICLHGDTPGALEVANAVRQALETAGIEVRRCT